MKLVQKQLAFTQALFAQHPFFERIAADSSIESMMSFAPRLAFWVMAFQDILRMNEQLITDPRQARVARHHRREDAGHDLWFLGDLERLGTTPGLRDVFGPLHRTTRDATYALAGETFRAPTDRVRVVLLLTLEAMGHVFFGKVAAAIEAHGWTNELKYFSDFHLQVEKRHEVFEDKQNEELFAQELSSEEREAAMALIGRASSAFTAMMDGLLAGMPAPQPQERRASAV